MWWRQAGGELARSGGQRDAGTGEVLVQRQGLLQRRWRRHQEQLQRRWRRRNRSDEVKHPRTGADLFEVGARRFL